MVRRPRRFAVRAIRTAISPRLAMRTEVNMGKGIAHSMPERHRAGRLSSASNREPRRSKKLGLGPSPIERFQELVRNRPPPVGKKPQQMAVARNTVEHL